MRLVPPERNAVDRLVLHLDVPLGVHHRAQVVDRCLERLVGGDGPRLEDRATDVHEGRADVDAESDVNARWPNHCQRPLDARWERPPTDEDGAQLGAKLGPRTVEREAFDRGSDRAPRRPNDSRRVFNLVRASALTPARPSSAHGGNVEDQRLSGGYLRLIPRLPVRGHRRRPPRSSAECLHPTASDRLHRAAAQARNTRQT